MNMKQNIEDVLAGQCKRVNELLNTPLEPWNGGIECVDNYHTETGAVHKKFVQTIEGGGYIVVCEATSTKSLSKMIDAFILGIVAANKNAVTGT